MTLKNLDISTLKNNRDITILNQPIRKKKKIDNGEKEFEYLYIGNIPSSYRSSDLRFFFKEFVEKSAFQCFHYRHRPEKQVVVGKDVATSCSHGACEPVSVAENDSPLVNNDKDNSSKKNNRTSLDKDGTTCCIVKICIEHSCNFFEKYHGKEWRNRELSFGKRTVNIKRIKSKTRPNDETMYKSRKDLITEKHTDSQEVYIEDLKCSLELNPPEYIMPNGNVGTTTKYFHGLIKECKMPASLIKSLGLEFPGSRKVYSNVPLNYTESCRKRKGPKARWSDSKQSDSTTNSSAYKSSGAHWKKSDKPNMDGEDDSDNDEVNEEDDAEDWERHEALHDDAYDQSRSKERLFEEDIELKWEKGGSGLVFYTDAYYWSELKGKDFDEDTVDDWDVDYSIYYEDGAGDKPARDQHDIRLQQRRREGKEDGPTKPSHLRRKEKHNKNQMNLNFAEFEKYSKGFGSRILKEQGWTEGSGVGSSREGISEPIDPEGQGPSRRTGLGYYGEKLDRTINLKKKVERDIRISTKYDEKDGESMDVMSFHGKDLLKSRER